MSAERAKRSRRARVAPSDERLVLEPSSQPPVISRLPNGDYIVWIHFALNFEAGTYLRLTPSGQVYREILNQTGEVKTTMIIAQL